VNRTYADISKSKAVLGYNPEFDFEEGIKNFVKWYSTSIYGILIINTLSKRLDIDLQITIPIL
jgi:dTDP-D-glucose 4,6-dehydratase